MYLFYLTEKEEDLFNIKTTKHNMNFPGKHTHKLKKWNSGCFSVSVFSAFFHFQIQILFIFRFTGC